MFKLGFNETGRYQGFYTPYGTLITAEPNQVVNIGLGKSTPSGFKPVKNFIEFVKERNENRFYLQRTFALGDTLMTVPVVRYLRYLGWDVWMRANSAFLPLFSLLGIQNETSKNPPAGVGLLIDWTVEQDVGHPVLGKMHRVDIYLEVLGIHKFDSDKLDWSCELSKFPDNPVDPNEKYVVFQGQGANKRKWLTEETIVRILEKLNSEGVKVYYTGNPIALGYENELFVHTRMKVDVLHLFSLIAGANCLLTMDSGPLWVSHFTKTPTVAILGPSHSDQRLVYHPLYPEGAIGIQTNEWIGCETCAEGLDRCHGAVSCLNANPERVANTAVEKVMRFWRVSE